MVKTVVCGPMAENSYLVIEGTRALLIDAGDDVAAFRGALSGLTLAAIVLTHAHFDHVLGAAPLAKEYGCPVYIHPEDMPFLKTPEGILYQKGLCSQPFVPLDAQPLFTGTGAVAGFEMEVIHTPGHTPGGVSVAMGEALFTGDTLFENGWGRTDFPGGDERALLASLRRLLARPGNPVVYPGHGSGGFLREIAARWGL